MASFVVAYAGSISTGDGESAGQGATVTEGHRTGQVAFSGGWKNTAGSSDNTLVPSYSFTLEASQDAPDASSVTTDNTTVYAQLLGDGTASNWTECTVAAQEGVVTYQPSGGQQMSIGDVINVNIVANSKEDDSSDPEVASVASSVEPFAVKAGGTGTDRANGVASYADGSSIIAGCFIGTATFGSGDNQVSLTSAGGTDVFLWAPLAP